MYWNFAHFLQSDMGRYFWIENQVAMNSKKLTDLSEVKGFLVVVAFLTWFLLRKKVFKLYLVYMRLYPVEVWTDIYYYTTTVGNENEL